MGILSLACILLAACLPVILAERRCDIVFCVDASDSMTLVRRNAAKTAIKEWARCWPVNPQVSANIGLLLFARYSEAPIRLNQHLGYDQVLPAVDAAESSIDNKGATNLHTCLSMSRTGTGFFKTGRSNARKYMVIITDGNSQNPAATKNEIHALKREGVTVIGITIAGYANYDDINELTQAGVEQAHRFHRDKYTDIYNDQDIINAICPDLCSLREPNPVQTCATSPNNPSIPCSHCLRGQSTGTPSQCDSYTCQIPTGPPPQTLTHVTEGCPCHQFRTSTGSCVAPSQGVCEQDPCSATDALPGWIFHGYSQTHCRTYWKCNLNTRTTIARTQCCQPYEYFDQSMGECMLDHQGSCTVPCACGAPPNPINGCRKYLDTSSHSSYYEPIRNRDGTWSIVSRTCPNGQIFYFAPELCKCDRPNLQSIIVNAGGHGGGPSNFVTPTPPIPGGVHIPAPSGIHIASHLVAPANNGVDSGTGATSASSASSNSADSEATVTSGSSSASATSSNSATTSTSSAAVSS